LCILEGKAEVVAGEEIAAAATNDIIIIPKGEKRGRQGFVRVNGSACRSATAFR